MLNAIILAIGDEILLGSTVNSNASWLSSQLNELGVNVLEHRTIPDAKGVIIKHLYACREEADIIITTGGLGSTNDDITVNAMSDYFKVDIIENKQAKKYIENYFKKKGSKAKKSHYLQALIPSISKPIKNDLGTAPGISTEIDNKLYFNLPGPPGEMKSVYNNGVKKLVNAKTKSLNTEIFRYKTIYTCGIFESDVYDKITEIKGNLKNVDVAYQHSYKGVRIRVGARGKSKTEVALKLRTPIRNIKNVLGNFVIKEDKSIEKAIGELLKSKSQTLSVAESCTAGGLSSVLTDESGSSEYFKGGFVVYSNEAKMDILGVKKKTLEKFGAVSEETAIEMAENTRKKLNVDFGISITGIAGPEGGTKYKPVGTVWIGISDKNKTYAKKYIFSKDRHGNRQLSIYTSLSMLYRKIVYGVE